MVLGRRLDATTGGPFKVKRSPDDSKGVEPRPSRGAHASVLLDEIAQLAG
jgi:hypothetical protein